MNAQYPITTTPKYNFPLPNESLQLPQQFIELSIRSLKRTHQPQITPNLEHFQHTTETKLVKLEPNPSETTVVAVDVSSIKIGETQTGILLAVRGAIVWKQDIQYRYLRLGPFPFHITEMSKNEIFRLSHAQETCPAQETVLPNIYHIQTRLTSLLERWIQTSVNQTTRNSLILLDGSLMTNTTETPIQNMERFLREARSQRNSILAFSKMTQLLLHGRRITSLVSQHPPPCLLKIQDFPESLGPMHSLGNVYVAKLKGSNYAFRLDIDKELSDAEAIEAVQKLLGNDSLLHSYPETLRLAHIFSTFTANEVLGIQRCLAEEKHVRIVTRPNIRRLLFGCFGKGPEGS